MTGKRNNEQRKMLDKEQKASQLRSAKTLVLIALFAAPISLLIGGIMLSVASIIISIVALTKIRSVLDDADSRGSYPRILYNQCVISLIMGIFTLGLNIYFFIQALPAVMEILNNGDLASLYGYEPKGPSRSSIWD